MSKNRRNHSSSFKAKVALEAAKGNLTVAEIAQKYQVHPTQITKWKKALLDNIPGIFEGKILNPQAKDDKEKDELYKQIGKLQVQVDFLERVSSQI